MTCGSSQLVTTATLGERAFPQIIWHDTGKVSLDPGYLRLLIVTHISEQRPRTVKPMTI